ncbi:MAG: hypothetical protein ACLPTZ_28795 [Beijerinckiaceae bacterium]
MKEIMLVAAIFMLAMVAPTLAGAATTKTAAVVCVPCVEQCKRCGADERCVGNCRSNGSPRVNAAKCGIWYDEESCRGR